MRWLLVGGWFLLPLLYYPNVAEYSNTPRWIFLSLLLPVLLLIPPSRVTSAHIAGLVVLLWASLSLVWGPFYEGLDRLAHWYIMGAAFLVGSRIDRRTFQYASIAFAVAVAIQIPLVASQVYEGVLPWLALNIYQSAAPAGLFANSNYLSETAALSVVILFLFFRQGVYFSLVPLGIIFLAKSGGGLLGIVAAGLFWLWGRHRLTAILCGITIVAMGSYYYRSIEIPRHPGVEGTEIVEIGRYATIDARLSLWVNSLAAVKARPLGYGVGSYWSAYPEIHDVVRPTHPQVYGSNVRPRSAHSDPITILFELGIPGLLLLFIAWRALRVRLRERYILIAILGSGLVGFPLMIPATAAMAALVTGFLVARDK